jgi:hypothetical protein
MVQVVINVRAKCFGLVLRYVTYRKRVRKSSAAISDIAEVGAATGGSAVSQSTTTALTRSAGTRLGCSLGSSSSSSYASSLNATRTSPLFSASNASGGERIDDRRADQLVDAPAHGRAADPALLYIAVRPRNVATCRIKWLPNPWVEPMQLVRCPNPRPTDTALAGSAERVEVGARVSNSWRAAVSGCRGRW